MKSRRSVSKSDLSLERMRRSSAHDEPSADYGQSTKRSRPESPVRVSERNPERQSSLRGGKKTSGTRSVEDGVRPETVNSRSSRSSKTNNPAPRETAPSLHTSRDSIGGTRRRLVKVESVGKWDDDDTSNVPRNSDRRLGRDEGNISYQTRVEGNAEDAKSAKGIQNFGLSGKLLEDTNMVNGVVITYSQPPEARMPKVRWRFYPFKGTTSMPTMYLHRQSAYLLGRDRRVVDIPLDHPSCSKQHAVIQYRLIPVEKDDGTVVRRVKPYVIDLNSGNGTFVNGKKIEPERFVELLEKDVVKFGFSSREYVMLHEGSKDDEYHSGEDLSGDEDEKK